MRVSVVALLLGLAGCFGGSDRSGAQLFPVGGTAPPAAPSGETSGGEPPGAVGVYRGGQVTLLLDADGGYEWRHASAVTRGRWRLVAADVVELAPTGGPVP